MENYNNGHIVDVDKIKVDDYEIAAKEWSEGSKSLEELLLYCLKNGIITQSCCIGHKDADRPFLQFEFSERNLNEIIKIIYHFYNLDGVNMVFVNQPGIISKFDINVPKNMGEQFFEDMLMQLSKEQKVELDSLPIDMKSTINAMKKHRVPNDYLEVQYSNNDNQKRLFVATNNPNYSDLYWDKENAKQWVEDSVGIEGTPEEIIPIINDITKKAPVEYNNYIESKKRTGYQKPSQPKKQQPSASIDNQPTTFLANPQATRENNYARQHNMTIVEVLPGMSIEQVAEEICGKRYICKFNNFEINGTKFTSPEQIVDAYIKNLEEGRKKHLEAKTNISFDDKTINPREALKNALKAGVTISNVKNISHEQTKDERSEEEHEQ